MVGNGSGAGLSIYSAVAVDAEGGSFVGLAGATPWQRSLARAKSRNDQARLIETKEGRRWIDAAGQALREQLTDRAPP